MFMSRRIAWVVIVTAALVALGCTAAMAADPVVSIGIVDLDKVHADAPRIKQFWEEIKAFQTTLEANLDVRVRNMLLSESEVVDLIALKGKDKRTPQEDARIKELEGFQDARAGELRTLEQTKELNDTQKARMKELQDIRKKSEDTGTATTKVYDGQLKAKVDEVDKKAEAELRDVISSVAKSSKVSVVVAKEAVLFGGVDITADVIKKLERKAQ